MSAERLQKVLARAGIASRRGAESLIREGRVTVNGRPAILGQKVDADSDAIKVDGRRVQPREPRHYLLVYKPDGFVTTRSDPEGRKTVLDLVPPRYHRGLFPVGRLDYHSEGLLILTDDGEFAQRVAHPSSGCRKTYEVKVKGVPSEETLRKLRGGVVLGGRRTLPARIDPFRQRSGRGEPKNTWWRVEIGEGRTRQIREMFYRAGHPVQRLRRVAIGGLADRGLPPGCWRPLTPAEIEQLSGPKRGRK